jgi:hypothetical protein
MAKGQYKRHGHERPLRGALHDGASRMSEARGDKANEPSRLMLGRLFLWDRGESLAWFFLSRVSAYCERCWLVNERRGYG